MKRISWVIPVFRNERAVTMTYERIRQVCGADLANYTYEVVFIDDRSDDGASRGVQAGGGRRGGADGGGSAGSHRARASDDRRARARRGGRRLPPRASG